MGAVRRSPLWPRRTSRPTGRTETVTRSRRATTYAHLAVRAVSDLSGSRQQSRLGFGRPENGEDLEDAGRDRRAGQSHAQRLGDLTEFQTLGVGEATDRLFELLLAPVGGLGIESRSQLGKHRLVLRRRMRMGLVVD